MERFKVMRRVGGAYRQVFATPAGRIVLKDMIRVVGLFRQSGPRDVAVLQYQEGARDFVRRLLRMAKLTDDQLDAITEESVDD